MSEHKHKGSRHTAHGKIVSGVLAAALAFTVVVASQVGVIDSNQLTAMVCPDGSTVPDGSPCPSGGNYQPPSGGTSQPPQMVYCPDGSSYPAPYTCPVAQTNVVCPDGSSHPSPYTCPTAATTTTTTNTTPTYSTGGSASSYVTEPTCRSGGYFWHFATNRCFSTMAELDAAGATGGTTGTYPNTTYPSTNYYPNTSYGTATADTVGACTARGGTWDAARSSCSVTGTGTATYPTNTYDSTRTGTYPNTMYGTGTADTVGACTARGGRWDAARSSCSVTGTGTATYPTGTMENSGENDCWNSSNTTRFASRECTDMRAKMNDSKMTGSYPTMPTNDRFNSGMNNTPDNFGTKYGFGNMMPMPPAFGRGGAAGTGMFPGFGGGHGTENQFFNDGNFMPPSYDTTELAETYSEYGFDQGNYEFDKYQIDWEAEYEGPQIQNVAQELKRLNKEGKGKLREITRFESELDRAKGRSGGNEACPAIANASAALSTAKAVIELMTNATEDNIEQALTAQGQLFGNWENPEGGIWNEVMTAIQGAHQCEQLGQMQKDGAREVKQMTKELSRVRDAETKAYLEEVLTEFSSVVNNLGDYYVPCEGGFGPCDPMEEARYTMDDLRMSFWDAMRDQQDGFQYDDVCGNFDMIRDHLSDATDIPDSILAKASKLLDKGVLACENGNIDAASKVLHDMEKLKNEFDGGEDGEGFGRDAEDYMREAAEFEFSDGEVDIDALMSRMEEMFLSKMESAVQAAVDRITQQFALKIAQMESDFATKLAEVQARALDNIGIAFEGDLKDVITEAKTEVTEAIVDFDKVAAAFEEEGIEIPAEVQEQIEELYEVTGHNLTIDAAEELKAEIDAVTNEVVVAFQEDPEAAIEVLAQAIPELTEEAERIFEEDRDARFDAGITAFVELDGQEDSWMYGYLTAANREGILNGNLNAEGYREANPGAATNWADAVTMMGRVAAGGAENVPDEVDLSNSVIRELPDYAQAPATYLINEGLIEPERLAEIYGNSNPGDAITRIEMMELVHNVLDLPVNDPDAISDFPDVGGLDAEARTAAASLVDLGIVGGEGNGDFNPYDELNRAAFAKIMVGAQEAAIDEGTLEFTEEFSEEFPTTQGGFEENEGAIFEENNIPTI